MNSQKLPNSTAVLILGIVSIISCCCYGVVGLISGIVGLFLAKKDKALYAQNPSQYTDYSTLNTGRILCIVGIVLNVLFLIYMIFIISSVGIEALSDPELLQKRMDELMPKN